MPMKQIEWSKCIIYKIWKDDDFYVGSTTDLASRKSSHKSISNNEKSERYNLKIYQTIREKGGWVAWEMTPLEEYKECKSQIEARIREEEWRVKLNAQLNMQRAHRSEENAKEDQILRDKKYYDKHRDERIEKKKIYNHKHKEKIQKYLQDNADKINKKFECKCGGKYTHQNKSKHEKTKKHQTYLATL
jgi:hypothetical protein